MVGRTQPLDEPMIFHADRILYRLLKPVETAGGEQRNKAEPETVISIPLPIPYPDRILALAGIVQSMR